MRSGLVEHENRRLREQRAGESDSLALAARELAPLLAHEGVEAVRQRTHPLSDPRRVERLLDLAVAHPGPAEPKILADARREEVRVLPGHGDGPANVLLPVLAQVPPAEGDASLLRIEEPKEQVRDSALSRAARTEERDSAPGLEPEAKAVKRRGLAGCVACANVLERDDKGPRRQRQRLLRIGDRGLLACQLEDPSPGCEGRGELSCRLGKGLNRLEGGQREQCQQRDRHPVEIAGRMRGNGNREHSGDRGAGDDQPESLAGAVSERGAPRVANEPVVGDAEPA